MDSRDISTISTIISILLAITIGITLYSITTIKPNQTIVTINERNYTMLLADGMISRFKGYKDEYKKPMIFVYEYSANPNFSASKTRNTELAFINCFGKIMQIGTMKKGSNITYSPMVKTDYVIEAPEGFFKKNNIKVNDYIKI